MGYREMPLALRAPGLTWRQRAVLAVLAEYCHADKGYSTFVQQKTLAEDIGLATTNLSAELKKLKSAGFVSQVWQQVDGARRKVFIFHKEAIEAALWEQVTSESTDKSSQIEKSQLSKQQPEVSKSLTKSYQSDNPELSNQQLEVINLRTPYKGELNSTLNSSLNTNGLKGNLNASAPATSGQPVENPEHSPAALAPVTAQLDGQTDLLEATGYQAKTGTPWASSATNSADTDGIGALAEIIAQSRPSPGSETHLDPEAERARQVAALRQRYPEQL